MCQCCLPAPSTVSRKCPPAGRFPCSISSDGRPEGLFALSAAIAPVKVEAGEMVSGIVDVEAPHLFPLFRRDSPPAAAVSIRRISQGCSGGFQWITEPAAGIEITAADVLVRRSEVTRFEEQHGLFGGRQKAAAPMLTMAGRRRGPPERYDWDRFHGALTRYIHDHGVPQTQSALIKEMISWFEAQSVDHVPDESTVAKKVKAVWIELHRA